jgi:uncharacterized protein
LAAIYTVPFVLRKTLQLELKDIKAGVLEQEYSVPVSDFSELQALAEAGEGVYLGSLLFRLRFQLSGRIVEVDGTLLARVELECGRCLCRYQQDVKEDFSLTFTPVLNEASAEQDEVELDAHEMGLVYYRDDVLELLPSLQEQAIMALPLAHLCDIDCLGLCPECGQNLNEAQCDCTPKLFNNNFGALASLLDKKK